MIYAALDYVVIGTWLLGGTCVVFRTTEVVLTLLARRISK